MTRLHSSLLALLAASAASSTLAFQPLMTDDTGTQGDGGNQLEFSYTENKAETAAVPTVSPSRRVISHVIPVVYTRGLTDSLDAFLQLNEGGTGNPSFGVKWRFYENEGSGTSFALKAEGRHPLNPKGEPITDVVRTTYGVTAILSQDVPFGAIHANLFSSQDTFRDERDPARIPAGMGGAAAKVNPPSVATTRFSVAPVWQVSEEFKLVGEAGTQYVKTTGAGTVTSTISQLGMVYSPNKDLDFALGVTRTTDDANPRTSTTASMAGVTWRFK